ncbi:MAG: ATP-binding protein [Myxococcota bacterium]
MAFEPVKIELSSRYEDICLGTEAVEGFAVRLGFPEEEAQMLAVATAELLNNVVEHAYREEPGHRIAITLHVQDDRMVLRVKDDGRPVPHGLLDGVSLPEVDPDDVSSLAEGGMGLFIATSVFECLSWVACASGGNELNASVPLPVAACP